MRWRLKIKIGFKNTEVTDDIEQFHSGVKSSLICGFKRGVRGEVCTEEQIKVGQGIWRERKVKFCFF